MLVETVCLQLQQQVGRMTKVAQHIWSNAGQMAMDGKRNPEKCLRVR